MPQNQFISKISAFIGFTLLLLIVGFTILVNLFPIKTKEEILQSKTLQPFTQDELADLWELDSIQTSITYPVEGEQKCTIRTTTNYYLGILKFQIDIDQNVSEPLMIIEESEILYSKNEKDSIFLNRIGHLFMKYQIKNIVSNSYYGDFTAIHLIDGRIIILMEKKIETEDKYYEKIIEKADFVNETTKVISPLEATKIYKEIYVNLEVN